MTYRATLEETGSPGEAWTSVVQIGYLAIVILVVVAIPLLTLR
jgi:hypothetical protein